MKPAKADEIARDITSLIKGIINGEPQRTIRFYEHELARSLESISLVPADFPDEILIDVTPDGATLFPRKRREGE